MLPAASIERKNSHQSQVELQKMLLSGQLMILIGISQDGAIKYVNQPIADIFGGSREELLQWNFINFAQIVHLEDLPFVTKQAQIVR